MSALSKEFEFFTFLLVQYAEYKHTSADKVLKQWDKLGITDFINSMYEQYHSEAIENAFADIDRITSEKTAEKKQ